MDKNIIIESVLMYMTNELNVEQINSLRECLGKVLYKYEIREYYLDCKNDDNDYFVKKFKSDLTVEGLSQKTIKQYVRETLKFLKYTNKNFREINKDDIMNYFGYLSDNGLSSTTIDNSKKFITSFFTWCTNNEFIYRNPFQKIKKLKRNIIKNEVLSDGELEILRDSCKTKRELALIDFLSATGVRVSECSNLLMKNVDLNNGKCTIFAPKTQTYREVFLDAKAIKHITDYRQELHEKNIYSEYLFTSYQKNHTGNLSVNSIENIIHNIVNRTNISKKITVHIFRKTLATKLHKKGAKPITISTILGHSDFSTTEKYYINVSRYDLLNEYDICMN